ncbi:MAG: hypothetical protein ACI361_03685 [Atopobiaceae bacterium]
MAFDEDPEDAIDFLEDPDTKVVKWTKLYFQDVTGAKARRQTQAGEGYAYLAKMLLTLAFLAEQPTHTIDPNDPEDMEMYAYALCAKGSIVTPEEAASFLLVLQQAGIVEPLRDGSGRQLWHAPSVTWSAKSIRKKAYAQMKAAAARRANRQQESDSSGMQSQRPDESPKKQADTLTAPMVDAWNRTNRPAY